MILLHIIFPFNKLSDNFIIKPSSVATFGLVDQQSKSFTIFNFTQAPAKKPPLEKLILRFILIQ